VGVPPVEVVHDDCRDEGLAETCGETHLKFGRWLSEFLLGVSYESVFVQRLLGDVVLVVAHGVVCGVNP
jgi:hypothetical protein